MRWLYLAKGLKRPRRVAVCDARKGKATVGDNETAIAGYDGIATAGDGGTATAGYKGTATAGYRGTATAGAYGKATAGTGGTAIAGDKGTATAGHKGRIEIEWFDLVTTRYRKAVGYIGENGLKPNTAYKVDDQGKFVEVPEPSKQSR